MIPLEEEPDTKTIKRDEQQEHQDSECQLQSSVIA